MSNKLLVPDGLSELKREMPIIVDLIARTTRWVHPDSFRALPVWYPETARGRPMFDAKWQRQYGNTNRTSGQTIAKTEPNIQAGKAFVAALGTKKTSNWTVCHIWGVDDPKFQKSNRIVRDPRYYSCVGNMVWLPTPLKGFTDAVPEIKEMLRVCAYHLYGWACEHEDVAEQAQKVRSGFVPDAYPEIWPAPGRDLAPPGLATYGKEIALAIAKRKEALKWMLADETLTHFPREEVRQVLDFWRIEL